jgi:ankyrin repeat protein
MCDAFKNDVKSNFEISWPSPENVAAHNGDVETIRALADQGVDLDVGDIYGSTPLHMAAYAGQVDMIRVLIELGATIDVCTADGDTPLYVASCKGHVDTIEVLAELGGDVNSPNGDGLTPAYIAAYNGYTDVLRTLVARGAKVNAPDVVFIAAAVGAVDALQFLIESRVDIELGTGIRLESTPLWGALSLDNKQTSNLLINLGASVANYLQTAPPDDDDDCIHIQEMVRQVLGGCGVYGSAGDAISLTEEGEGASSRLSIFSLTKLMTSELLDEAFDHGYSEVCGDTGSIKNGGYQYKMLFETSIATAMQGLLSNTAIEKMQNMCYVLKRRLVRVAWRVYQSSLLLDGSRLSELIKAQRYLEVVCLLFDWSMLSDVAALRMTCKSNNERRRFPVVSRCLVHQELEGNLIEEFVGYASSRYVSTDIMFAVLAIHRCYI